MVILPDTGLHDACGVTSFALAFRKQLARLEHLGLDGFWSDLPRIQDWLEAARARPAFEAIQNHLDSQYLAIMKGSSEEYRERIETLTGTKQ